MRACALWRLAVGVVSHAFVAHSVSIAQILILQVVLYLFIHAACVYAAHVYVDPQEYHQELLDAIFAQNQWILGYLRQFGAFKGKVSATPPSLGAAAVGASPAKRGGGGSSKWNWGLILFLGFHVITWLMR